MSAYLTRLLAEFVNREAEMARFRAMLDGNDVCVFAVWGSGGVGKSSLQAKMIHEVANRGIEKAEIVWSETRNHDLMAITRKIRDDLGPEHFAAFTDLVNFFTVPQYQMTVNVTGAGPTSVAEQAAIRESHTGDIAGILIKDVMLTEPRSDMQISDNERRARLTDAFIDGMARALADRPAVIFFDATEKMSTETENWIWGELLLAACEGRLGEGKFLLCGRKEPEINRMWGGSIDVAELRPLQRDHIFAYLQLRGVPGADHDLADWLLIASEGNMLKLATHVDAYLLMVKRRQTGVAA